MNQYLYAILCDAVALGGFCYLGRYKEKKVLGEKKFMKSTKV